MKQTLHFTKLLIAPAIAGLLLASCTKNMVADQPVVSAKPLPPMPTRDDSKPRASENAETKGIIDGVQVAVTYGRPQVKNRTLWGGLVPYGKVWRAGANEATVIAFSEPVTIGGTEIEAKSYALFVIPNEDKWTFILNSEPDQWGAYKHNPQLDVLRFDAKPSNTDEHVEALKFTIDDSKISLHWGNVVASFSVTKA